MRITLIALLGVVACQPSTPPEPPAPRTATEVATAFSKTWDATIDIFAERNIAIRNLDRASGLIVAEPQSVRREDGQDLASCGTVMGMSIPANTATWNVLVRGDSSKATVKATVRFQNITTGQYGSTTSCSSRGVWEGDLEKEIKTRAEAKK